MSLEFHASWKPGTPNETAASSSKRFDGSMVLIRGDTIDTFGGLIVGVKVGTCDGDGDGASDGWGVALISNASETSEKLPSVQATLTEKFPPGRTELATSHSKTPIFEVTSEIM